MGEDQGRQLGLRGIQGQGREVLRRRLLPRAEGRQEAHRRPPAATEVTDRGVKSSAYRATASLRQYALIAQDEPWVEIYTRDDRGWRLADVNGLDGACLFSEIDCVVPMSELYEGVLDIQPVE